MTQHEFSVRAVKFLKFKVSIDVWEFNRVMSFIIRLLYHHTRGTLDKMRKWGVLLWDGADNNVQSVRRFFITITPAGELALMNREEFNFK